MFTVGPELVSHVIRGIQLWVDLISSNVTVIQCVRLGNENLSNTKCIILETCVLLSAVLPSAMTINIDIDSIKNV